jgi:hypothetical protein
MSLRELGRLTGLSSSYLSAVRSGKQQISNGAFICIASLKFLRVKLEASRLDDAQEVNAGVPK